MAIWKGRNVEVLMTSVAATSSSAFSLGTDFAANFKSVEFKEPERDVEEVPLLGETSGASNKEIYSKDAGFGELSGELILTPKDASDTLDLDSMFFTKTANAFSYGDTPLTPSMMIRFGGATDFIAFIMSEVTLKSMGGVSVDADGEATQSLSVSAKAASCYKEVGGTMAD